MPKSGGSAGRREALADFYARRHRGLYWAVRRGTGGVDDDLIHEACATAWLALVRRADVPLDGRGYAWLLVTATHVHSLVGLAVGRHPLRGEARRAYREHQVSDPAPDAVAEIDELRDRFANDHDPLERALDAELHGPGCCSGSGSRPKAPRTSAR